MPSAPGVHVFIQQVKQTRNQEGNLTAALVLWHFGVPDLFIYFHVILRSLNNKNVHTGSYYGKLQKNIFNI